MMYLMIYATSLLACKNGSLAMPKNNQCIIQCNHSKVKIEDGNQKAVFLNPERKTYFKSQVDKCLIQNKVACDWIISEDNISSVVVEFKGRDVEHALIQVEIGMNFLSSSKDLPKLKKAALIVCSGVKKTPKFNSKLQRIKTEFSKKYKAPLHIVNGTYEYEINKVLSFKGPF